MTDKEAQAHLTATVMILGATPAEDPYFKGTIAHSPFLLKVTSIEPLNYLIKIRTNKTEEMYTDWPSTLEEPYTSADISAEVEDGYIFLWIRKAESLSAMDIHSLLQACVSHFTDLLPISPGYCHTCQQYNSATPTHSKSTIANICEPCLDQHARKQAEEDARLNASHAGLIPLALLSPILGGLLWAVYWFSYEWLMEALSINSTPRIVMAILVTAGAFGIGWPTGKLFHKSGLTKRINSMLLAGIAALTAAALGEFLHILYYMQKIFGSWELAYEFTKQKALTLIFVDDDMYIMMKILMMLILAYAIHFFGKKKKASLEL